MRNTKPSKQERKAIKQARKANKCGDKAMAKASRAVYRNK